MRREYAPDLPRIPAHGSELNQVWTNILDNAADVLTADDAAAAGADRPSIVVRTRRDGDWVVVELEDNGPGIPDALQARVFDPFFTTKAPGAGVGLGLNISHTIITQRHKGKLTVASRPGRTSLPGLAAHRRDARLTEMRTRVRRRAHTRCPIPS